MDADKGKGTRQKQSQEVGPVGLPAEEPNSTKGQPPAQGQAAGQASPRERDQRWRDIAGPSPSDRPCPRPFVRLSPAEDTRVPGRSQRRDVAAYRPRVSEEESRPLVGIDSQLAFSKQQPVIRPIQEQNPFSSFEFA